MWSSTFQNGVQDVQDKRSSSVLDDARRLLKLRAQLEAEEERLAKERLELARRYANGDAERIAVPAEEFERWFEKEHA